MTEQKEAVTITVDEKPSFTHVKQETISIKLDNQGKGTGRTAELNGMLKCIIRVIPAESTTLFFKLSPTNYPDFIILQDRGTQDRIMQPTRVYFPKVQNTDTEGQFIEVDKQFSEIPLLDTVDIEITGGNPDSKVDFVIKYA